MRVSFGSFLLVLVLLTPSLPAESEERDRAQEVKGGALVHAYISGSAGATGTRGGTSEGGIHTRQETRSYHVDWDATLTLRPSGNGGTLSGSALGAWVASASHALVTHYESKSPEGDATTVDDERHCSASGYKGALVTTATATPEAEGLRVVLTGYTVPNMMVDGACQWSRVETSFGETESSSGSAPLEFNVPLVVDIDGNDYDSRVELLVPYDGRASTPMSYSAPLPGAQSTPTQVYCGMGGDSLPYAKGSCGAAGSITVRTFVDPCPYIRTAYAGHFATLAGLQPPVGDEAAIRAWSGPARDAISAVLGDHRAWQLVGCAGDLTPDPWDAMGRALLMQRDALLKLLREGKLSREGISELLGAERSAQLIGASSETSADFTLEAIMSSPHAEPSGTLEVSVHSPVSLHAWSAEGGHVGWDRATNTSVSTIEGATYQGAPGGAQTLILPAGFYKVTVDELAPGSYVLDARTNGTGADAEDAHFIQSKIGRSTSTHFGVTMGWDGPRLDLAPVRRGDTPSVVTFIDAGRPSTTHAAPDGQEAGSKTDASARDTPWPAVGAALIALAIVAAARRRR